MSFCLLSIIIPKNPHLEVTLYTDKAERIALYLTHIENLIGWKNSTIHITQFNNVIKIIPCKEWTKCMLRRSLLTALIRTGMCYGKDGTEESILRTAKISSYFSSNNTYLCFEKFIKGNVHYIGKENGGWVDVCRKTGGVKFADKQIPLLIQKQPGLGEETFLIEVNGKKLESGEELNLLCTKSSSDMVGMTLRIPCSC